MGPKHRNFRSPTLKHRNFRRCSFFFCSCVDLLSLGWGGWAVLYLIMPAQPIPTRPHPHQPIPSDCKCFRAHRWKSSQRGIQSTRYGTCAYIYIYIYIIEREREINKLRARMGSHKITYIGMRVGEQKPFECCHVQNNYCYTNCFNKVLKTLLKPLIVATCSTTSCENKCCQ